MSADILFNRIVSDIHAQTLSGSKQSIILLFTLYVIKRQLFNRIIKDGTTAKVASIEKYMS